MSEPDFTDQEPEPEEWTQLRDPGAGVDGEGVPEVADESTPGTGEVPEPEIPVTPNEAPVAAESYGTTPWEQQHPEGIDERVAQEVPEDDAEPDQLDGQAPETAALRVDEDEPGPDAEN